MSILNKEINLKQEPLVLLLSIFFFMHAMERSYRSVQCVPGGFPDLCGVYTISAFMSVGVTVALMILTKEQELARATRLLIYLFIAFRSGMGLFSGYFVYAEVPWLALLSLTQILFFITLLWSLLNITSTFRYKNDRPS